MIATRSQSGRSLCSPPAMAAMGLLRPLGKRCLGALKPPKLAPITAGTHAEAGHLQEKDGAVCCDAAERSPGGASKKRRLGTTQGDLNI